MLIYKSITKEAIFIDFHHLSSIFTQSTYTYLLSKQKSWAQRWQPGSFNQQPSATSQEP